MFKLRIAMAAGLVLVMGATQAQVQRVQPQQDKMALCDKAAGSKKGAERKSFMGSCMGAQSVTAQSVATQSVMAGRSAGAMKMSGCEHASRAEDL